MSGVYIFDLDGTLIDSMAYFAKGILSVLDDEGIEYGEDMLNTVTPLGYRGSAELYKSMGAKASVEEMVKKIETRLVYEYTNNIVLKPGVEKYLRKIKSEGARLYVLTASPHIVTDVCLKHNGVFELFDEVWSVDDWGLTKSGTELFDRVAEKVGVDNADVHYFDDNLIAVENSARAGYDVYAVYDRHTDDEVHRLKELAPHFVRSFEELI